MARRSVEIRVTLITLAAVLLAWATYQFVKNRFENSTVA
ncbi:hypothetical protein PflQ8_1637 [Pseudomonas fluorescens Q8r1-96]|nr:hypothetical protein PflQ8_1637 [Pseudomonas fluorescens Q8r1-96]